MTDEVVDEGPGESVDLAEEVIEETVADAEAEDGDGDAEADDRSGWSEIEVDGQVWLAPPASGPRPTTSMASRPYCAPLRTSPKASAPSPNAAQATSRGDRRPRVRRNSSPSGGGGPRSGPEGGI